MENEQEKIKRKAEKVIKNKGNLELAQLEATMEVVDKLEDMVETMTEHHTEIINKPEKETPEVQKIEITNSGMELAGAFFSMLKGEKGDSRTDEEVQELIKPLIPEPIKGQKGDKGDKGNDGKDGKDGLDGLDGKDGLNGKDGSPDTREQIVEKINSGDEESPKINAKQIEGLDFPTRIELQNEVNRVSRMGGSANIEVFKTGNKVGSGSGLNFTGSGVTVTNTNGQITNIDIGAGGASAFTDLTDVPSSYSGQGTKFVRVNGAETALEFATVSGGGDALTSAPLSQFATTTSAQLAGVISDETGSGALVFGTDPTFTTRINTPEIKATSSAGIDIHSNAGTQVALFGAGGGANSTFYGGAKFDYSTASTVPYFDASKNLISSAVTPTELGYVSGVTSAIQTQLNAKQATITFGTGVQTALGVNIGSAGAPVLFNGAGGTPSSMVGTNITGTASGLTAGTVTTNANLTGVVTSVGNATAIADAALSIAKTSGLQTALDAKAPLASPTFTGTVTIPAATISGNLNFSAVPATDHTAIGPTISAFNLGATIALMDLCYLGSSSKWLLTDADAASTTDGLLGICLDGGVDTDTTTMALPGSLVRDDSWNWTPGVPLYVDTATPGQIVATPPSGTDDGRRRIGFAVTADVIYFMPGPIITHV